MLSRGPFHSSLKKTNSFLIPYSHNPPITLSSPSLLKTLKETNSQYVVFRIKVFLNQSVIQASPAGIDLQAAHHHQDSPPLVWSAYSAGDLGSIPELGRSPGEGNGNPLQYSCLENPMDRQVWQTIAHGAAELDTAEHLSLLLLLVWSESMTNSLQTSISVASSGIFSLT